MDQTMQAKWRRAEPPFDGSVVWPNTDLSRDQLVQVALHVLSFVARRTGLPERLMVNEDWHNHDGYVTTSKEVESAVFLQEIANSDSAWYRLMDTFVYWGIYSRTMEFYFRFGMGDEESTGYFDLSSTPDLASELARDLAETFDIPVEVEPAKELFDRTYAG